MTLAEVTIWGKLIKHGSTRYLSGRSFPAIFVDATREEQSKGVPCNHHVRFAQVFRHLKSFEMSTTSTDTAIYNPKDDVLSTSRLLGSSIGSLSLSRNINSKTSKTYKQARDLFLTCRLPEAYSTIQSLVSVPPVSDEDQDSDDPRIAPIATASRSQRIKVWSLYLTLLNAICELGLQEGKAQFGSREWSRLTSKASGGSIWSEVVQNGYGGVDGNVDADVVVNLYAV